MTTYFRTAIVACGFSIAMFAAQVGPGFAATPALSVSGPTVWPNGDNQDWSLGWEFSVSSPTTVVGLGYNDFGFSSGHTVGIYDSSGNLLTSAVVTGASTLINGYRYDSIAPLTLGVGDYFIAGTTYGVNDGWTYQAAGWTTTAGVSYIDSWYTSGGGGVLSFPGTNADGRQYFEVNFLTASVPEPSTWAMLALGFAGLGFAGRRAHRVPARA